MSVLKNCMAVTALAFGFGCVGVTTSIIPNDIAQAATKTVGNVMNVPVKKQGLYVYNETIRDTNFYEHPSTDVKPVSVLKKGTTLTQIDDVIIKKVKYANVMHANITGYVFQNDLKEVHVNYGAYKKSSKTALKKRYTPKSLAPVTFTLEPSTNTIGLTNIRPGRQVQILGTQTLDGVVYAHVRYYGDKQGFTLKSNLAFYKK